MIQRFQEGFNALEPQVWSGGRILRVRTVRLAPARLADTDPTPTDREGP